MPSRYLHREKTLCEWCGRRAVQDHHLIYRSHGGDDAGYQDDPVTDANGNIVQLCLVCHDAAHRRFTIDLDGFTCLVCHYLAYCDAGHYLAALKHHARPQSPQTLQDETLGPETH